MGLFDNPQYEAYTSYGYDAATGAVLSIRDNATFASTGHGVASRVYTRDAAGDITSATNTTVYPAATTEVSCYAHDGLGELTQVFTPGSGSSCSTTPSASVLGGPAPLWDTYTYDTATGNRTGVTVHDTSGSGSDVSAAYSYPAGGASRPHGVTAVSGTAVTGAGSYGYDADGNMTSAPGQTLAYDESGKLASVTTSAGTQQDVYDASGTLLLQVDAGGAARLFLGDTVLTQSAAGVVSGVRTYSSNGVHIAEVSATAGVSGSSLTWLFSDVDGTVDTQTVATTGATTSQYRDPFGNGVGASSGVWADGNGFLNKPASTDTGLTSLGDRFYDATLGRFTSADPVLAVGNPQQVNAYSYAANDPITNTDPSGDCYETGAVSDYLTHTTNCANGAHGANAAGAVTAPGASPVHGSSGGSRAGRAPAAASGAHAASNAPSWLAGGKQAALDAGRGKPINWAAVGIGAGIGVLALLGIACVIATVGVCAFLDVGVGAGVGAGVAEGAEVAVTAAEVASAGDTAAGAGASESEIGDLVATCGGESFTPDTAVRLASGGAVAISALKVGDRVLATNPSTGKAEPKTVQRVWVNHDTDLMDLTVKTAGSTAVIHTTQHHPIWDASKRSFVDADQLRVGDQLDSHSGATVTVLSTQVVAGSADMWDLTVDSDHDFYVATVTDVLVHNCPIEPRDVHGELNAASREIDVNHVIDNGDLYLNMGKEQSIRVLDRGDGTSDAVIRDLNGMNRITAFNAKNGYVENRVATGEWQ